MKSLKCVCFLAVVGLVGSFTLFPALLTALQGQTTDPCEDSNPQYVTDFDSMTLGSIHGQQDWVVEQGTAEIVDTVKYGTSGRSLKLVPPAPAAPNLFSQAKLTLQLAQANPPRQPTPVMFLDFQLLPAASLLDGVNQLPSDQDTLDIDGARIGLFRQAGAATAEFYVYDGEAGGSGSWLRTGKTVAVNVTTGVTTSWVRLSLREDFVNGTWDIWIDGVPTSANLSFCEENTSYTKSYIVMGHLQQPVYLDSLTINGCNPIGTDSDFDGMPDDYENHVGGQVLGHNLNPTIDDRNGDKNGNGLSNIWEYIASGGSYQDALLPSGNPDNDGLINDREVLYNTNPNLVDTDGDGRSDIDEIAAGNNPTLWDKPLTTVDVTQTLAIKFGKRNSADGGNYVASVYEWNLNRTQKHLRFKLSAPAIGLATENLFCRAAADYEIRINRYPASTTSADYVLEISASVTSGGQQPQIEDEFGVLRPENWSTVYGNSPPAPTLSALSGFDEVVVVGLPKALFRSPLADKSLPHLNPPNTLYNKGKQPALINHLGNPFHVNLQRSDVKITPAGSRVVRRDTQGGSGLEVHGSDEPLVDNKTYYAGDKAETAPDQGYAAINSGNAQDSSDVMLQITDEEGNPLGGISPAAEYSPENTDWGSGGGVSDYKSDDPTKCTCAGGEDESQEDSATAGRSSSDGLNIQGGSTDSGAPISISLPLTKYIPPHVDYTSRDLDLGPELGAQNYGDATSAIEFSPPGNNPTIHVVKRRTSGNPGTQPTPVKTWTIERSYDPAQTKQTVATTEVLEPVGEHPAKTLSSHYHTVTKPVTIGALHTRVRTYDRYVGDALIPKISETITDTWPAHGGDWRTVTKDAKQGTGLITRGVVKYRRLPFGEVVTEEIQSDPQQPAVQRKTVYDYWTKADGVSNRVVGKLRSIRKYDGSWEYFAYDTQGRKQKIVSNWLDGACPLSGDRCVMNGATESANKVVTIEFVNLGLRKETTTTRGLVTDLRWFSPVAELDPTTSTPMQGEVEEVAYSPTANLGDPLNQKTTTLYFGSKPAGGSAGIALATGKLAKLIRPDGTFEIHQFSGATQQNPQMSEHVTKRGHFAGNTQVIDTITTRTYPNSKDPNNYTEQTVRCQNSAPIQNGALSSTTHERITAANRSYTEKTTDLLSNVVSESSYDATGLLLSETAADGTKKTYRYDDEKRVDAICTEKHGIKVTRYYQKTPGIEVVKEQAGDFGPVTNAARTISSTTTGGSLEETTASVDERGLTTTETTTYGQGEIIRTRVSGNYTEVSVTYPDGSPKRVARTNETGQLVDVSSTRYGGHSGDLPLGTVEQTNYPDIPTLTFYSMGRVTKISRPELEDVLYSYDSAGRVIATTQGTVIQRVEYDAEGRIWKQGRDVDQDGILSASGLDRITKTEYNYDVYTVAGVTPQVNAFARRSKTYTLTENYSSVWSELNTNVEWFSEGVTAQYTTNAGVSWSRSEQFPGGSGSGTVTKSYSQNADFTQWERTTDDGLLIREIQKDLNGGILQDNTYTYDNLARVESVQHFRKGITTFSYSADNSVITVTSPPPSNGAPNPISETTYDIYGRVVKQVNRDSVTSASAINTTHYAYYPTGKLKAKWGAGTYPITYHYDLAGRMTSMTTYQATEPVFDAAGNVTNSVPENTTYWYYNTVGQLNGKFSPGFDEDGDGTPEPGRWVFYGYDGVGRLVSRNWARGLQTLYYYHPYTGDLVYVDYPADSQTRDLLYRHDRVGRVIQVNEGDMTGWSPTYQLLQAPIAGNWEVNLDSWISMGQPTGTVQLSPFLSLNLDDYWYYNGWYYSDWYGGNYSGYIPWMTTNYTLTGCEQVPISIEHYFDGYFWLYSYDSYDENEMPIYTGGLHATAHFLLPVEIQASFSNLILEQNDFNVTGETYEYSYSNGIGAPPTEKIIGRFSERNIETVPTRLGASAEDRFADESFRIQTTTTDGEILTGIEMEVEYFSEEGNQLTKVRASVKHELDPDFPRVYEFNYHYGYGAVVNGVHQPLDQRLLVSRDGPPVGNPAQPCYTTHYTYESGRDGLLSMENTLNVGHMNANGTRNAAGWVASSHGYDLDAQGRRVTHRERLKRAGNWNGWGGVDRVVDRAFSYDFRDQLTGSTSTFPEGTQGLLPENTASGRLAEAESYTYDALGNRLTSTTPKSILAADWWVATPPSGAGNADTYVPSAANTYNSVTRNAGTPAVYKYDADGNLLDDGLCVYTWDAENRLLSVDPKTLSQYGECRYRFGYDYLSRRVRRSVDCFGGTWFPVQRNAFVYHGWNMVLNEHQDVNVTNGGWNPARMDRYVWGRDVSGTIEGAGGVGGLLMTVSNPMNRNFWSSYQNLSTVAYYYLYDGNGNVTDTVDENGFIMGQYRYDGFGNLIGQNLTTHRSLTNLSGGQPTTNFIDQPFLFSTKWQDETEAMSTSYGHNGKNRVLYYYGYRYYLPQLGRWMSRDPIGERGGVNLFGMCRNNPVGFIDILGLQWAQAPVRAPVRGPVRAPVRGPLRGDQLLPGQAVAVEGGANVVLPTEDLGNGGYNTWFVYYLHNLLSGTLHQELPPPPEPEWPKDAYPPQMSAPQPSEEELERRRKLREEGERVKKLPKVPRADCVKGQCDVFAKAELKRRRKNGECCELIQYQSRLLVTGRFGSIWTQVGLFGPDSISGNGNHVGVICGEGKTPRDISDIINDKSTIYDNNIPTGVSGYYWINGAYFVEDPKTGDYVTFLKSHMNKTGIIKIDGKLP